MNFPPRRTLHYEDLWFRFFQSLAFAELQLCPETWHYTVRWRYDTVNFLQYRHNIHPIARPSGGDMGCLLSITRLIRVQLLSTEYSNYLLLYQSKMICNTKDTFEDVMTKIPVFSFRPQCVNASFLPRQFPTRLTTVRIMLHDDVIKWKHFRVTGPLCRGFTGLGEFPTQRPVTING